MKGKKEIIIGICVVLSILILFAGINYLKGINVFKAANYYYATYEDVAGLQVSSPVTLNGFKVGQVRDIAYDYDNPGHVKVEISLDKALKVPVGSKAIIKQDLLGTPSIVLQMSDSNDYHDVGHTLIGETSKGLMDNVSDDLLPALAQLLPKVDSILTSVNNVVGDPALIASVRRLDAMTADLEVTMKQLRATSSTLPGVMENVNGITTDFRTVSSDLAAVSGQLKEMPIDSTMQNIYTLSENLKVLSAELNNPESSLGKLTHDKELYDNLNSCAASLDSLLIDVKRNPKRYISIKLL